MKKRDKLIDQNGLEFDCNIIGFFEGLNGKKIIVYTTADNEKELLASYYVLDGKNFRFENIESDEEWDNLEQEFDKLKNKLLDNKKEII